METTAWLSMLDEFVAEVLSTRGETLQAWRTQVPVLSGKRPKNFEYWLLVELVQRLRKAQADPIRTNGYLKGWMPSYWNRRDRFSPLLRWLREEGLKGPKTQVKSLNPDISVVLPDRRVPVNLDVKTQISPQEIFIDALIAKWHNEREAREGYHQGFLWALLEPQEDPFQSRFRRSADKLCAKAASRWKVDLVLKEVAGAPGVRYALIAPGL